MVDQVAGAHAALAGHDQAVADPVEGTKDHDLADELRRKLDAAAADAGRRRPAAQAVDEIVLDLAVGVEHREGMTGLDAVAEADIHGHDLVMADRIVAASNADDAGAVGNLELGRTRIKGQVVEVWIDRQDVVAGAHFHFGLQHLELGRIAIGQHFGARDLPELIADDVAFVRKETELATDVDRPLVRRDRAEIAAHQVLAYRAATAGLDFL